MGAQYLRNLANTLMCQLGITLNDVLDGGAQGLYRTRSEEIKAQLHRMRPETLGKIAAHGAGYRDVSPRTALYQVHLESYLDKYASGMELLEEIACTAIVAEMTDILERLVVVEGSQILPERK